MGQSEYRVIIILMLLQNLLWQQLFMV